MHKLALTFAIVLTCGAFAYAGPEPLPTSGKEMKEVAPAPPTCDFSWTGFYIGGRLGGGWSAGDFHNSDFLPASVNVTVEPKDQDIDASGFIGGGELGFNWQFGHFVVGAETDFSWADLNGDSTRGRFVSDTSPPDIPLRSKQEIDWLGTVRGRIGYAPWCRLMIYGTGGFAYASVDNFADLDYPAVNAGTVRYLGSRSDTQTGWTAGGGLEFGLTRHWTIKAEYLYMDLGDGSAIGNPVPPNPPFQLHYTWDTQFHTVAAGLNFKF